MSQDVAKKVEKRNIYDRILSLDRRYIYLIILITVIMPVIFPLNLPVFITNDVLGVYNEVDKVQNGSKIFVTVDYEPGSTPEMDPMAKAILLHCFMKDLEVVAISFFADGAGVGETLFKEVSDLYKTETGKTLVNGVDYTFLGYKPGSYALIIGLTQDIFTAAPEDHYGNKTKGLKVLEGVKSLSDFPYLVCLHDDAYLDSWIIYGHERTGIKMGSCCTAIMATGSYPFLNAGQVTGIVGGLKGASEYEKLVNTNYLKKVELKSARQGMDSQSVIHILIIMLMILGNIAYIGKTRLERKERLK